MECRAARALAPGYLDGELSEAQAAPLRRHLLDCPECRATVQRGKALSAWFPKLPEVEVPAGFAERVARLAFASGAGGESGVGVQSERDASVATASAGEREHVLQPTGREARAGGFAAEVSSMAGSSIGGGSAALQWRVREQLSGWVAAAAVVLVTLSISFRMLQRPGAAELQAQDGSLTEALEQLDALNRVELEGAESGLVDPAGAADSTEESVESTGASTDPNGSDEDDASPEGPDAPPRR